MSSIYLPDAVKARLIQAARRRGFVVERGSRSQLAEYLEYLVTLDEQTGSMDRPKSFQRLRGLLATGSAPPDDQAVAELLAERRMSK